MSWFRYGLLQYKLLLNDATCFKCMFMVIVPSLFLRQELQSHDVLFLVRN